MTVKHILANCRKYELQRQKYNLTQNLAENLDIDTINVLKFIRDTELHKNFNLKKKNKMFSNNMYNVLSYYVLLLAIYAALICITSVITYKFIFIVTNLFLM